MRWLLLAFTCCLGTIGCAVHDLRNDQDKIRGALLDLYTNQIMDNLVRAANGMPIIQLDYNNATAQLTIHEAAGASDTWPTTHSKMLTLAKASTSPVTRTIMNTVAGSLSADRGNQVSVTASPVNASPEAYDAYRQFLMIPGSLQVTGFPPPVDAAHLCKHCGDRYYWIPVEFKKHFLGLALTTVTDRVAALPPPDPFYSVTLVEKISQQKLPQEGIYRLIMKIDKKIPNDSGRVEIGSAGPSLATFQIAEYQPSNGQRVFQTDRLVIYFDASKAPAGMKTPEELWSKLPQPAKVYLLSHRPVQPAINSDINNIQFQLQQIQFNQIRSGP